MKAFSRTYYLYWWLWRKVHKKWQFCVILEDSLWIEGDPPFKAWQIIVCDRSGREVGWGVKPKEYCRCEMYTSLRKATKRVEGLVDEWMNREKDYGVEVA